MCVNAKVLLVVYNILLPRFEFHMSYIGTGSDIMPEGIMALPVPIFAIWYKGLGNNLLHYVEDHHF